ncbi:DNA ligase D [Alkalibacillus haloalkaliphilus]|uniref:DNA ligase (ATP) n=1 Tax=Alkalibacillus haloalkaliphilus TaxID=94136 RepID=A0A511W3Q5_9BACI|nr:DNA ligase D [Alkalibacillus haloalkaliphilus]GEN45724.1 bifunctional non-homologous end joining protein LigD [Alkalibacillus haloalkaliphilus]
MWKPMLLTLVEDMPTGDNWVYEVKYDGFRCGLEWTEKGVKLWSRNGNDFTAQFPEITAWCENHSEQVKPHLPLFLDGELVVLDSELKGNFSIIQTRGRMSSKDRIQSVSQKRPATFMAFDLLQLKGKSLESQLLHKRRSQLEELFGEGAFRYNERLNIVKQYDDAQKIWQDVQLHQGEGVVAKNARSKVTSGKRSEQWQKIKNWRAVTGFLTKWNMENEYFDVSVYKGEEMPLLGKLKHGFSDEEKETLKAFVYENGEKINAKTWEIPPSVCLEIHCLEAKDRELREPVFHQFRFDIEPSDCTCERVREGLGQLPESVEISKPDKLLFPQFNKRDFVLYLREVAPLLLPRLQNKRLTMIRFPDGVDDHSFYQKHLPDYAPDFIQTVPGDEEDEDIICQDLQTLLWFGNHAAIEYHVPFNTVDSELPDEMVFDLDPPTLKQFSLAVFAAQLIKEMCEHQGYDVYVKTSGKTGLQLHIPLDEETTYDDTREFMEAVAKVLVEKYPEKFTIERLKKNRGNRLYIDYIQHAPGKTIIAPYSPRATKEGTVATPLFWDEVNESLDPRDYTMDVISKRLNERGCPFWR